MSHIIACPHCATQVRVPDRHAEKTFICPHCLADVNNPRPTSPIRAANINTNVKRDLSVGGLVLGALMGLYVLGILMAVSFINDTNRKGDAIPLLILSFGGLDVLISIAILRGLVRWGSSGVRTPSTEKMLGITLLSLGTLGAVYIFFFFTCVGLAMLH